MRTNKIGMRKNGYHRANLPMVDMAGPSKKRLFEPILYLKQYPSLFLGGSHHIHYRTAHLLYGAVEMIMNPFEVTGLSV